MPAMRQAISFLARPPGSRTVMTETFYDITDLLAYLRARGSVTGIQRVEARLLVELAKLPGAERSWCVVADPAGAGHRAWRLCDIFADAIDEVQALSRLFEHELHWKIWPSRQAVRRQLNRSGAYGWQRIAKKFDIYSRAVLAPKTLQRYGLERAAQPMLPPASSLLSRLPQNSALVLLGAGWNDAAVTAAARQHAASGGRVVHLVYDLIPHIHPNYFNGKLPTLFTKHFTAAVHYTSAFICISKHTQADLDGFLETQGRRIPSTVVPLAHEFAGYPRNARGCQPNDPRLLGFGQQRSGFFLCVGTLEIRKNGIALLKAWRRLRSELGEATPHLVFCGCRGWKMEPFFDLLASDRWLQERVHILSHADDADVAFLHEQSLGSIYPSLYEGWGLPVGEAAWLGRSCITSRESSLPEVCGALAEYVDPHSPESIAAAVRRLAVDASWRAWRERLIAAAPLRTWGQVAGDFQDALAASQTHAGRVRLAAA